jgi:cytochrome b561
MNDKPSSSLRYTNVAMCLRWAIALLILFNLGLGFFMEGFKPQLRAVIVTLHL